MNEHEHDNDLAGAYVLDALSPEERQSFEVHLASCAICQAEVAELQQVVGVLPLALTPVEPPAGLRDRVLDAITQEEAPSHAGLQVLSGGSPAPARRSSWWQQNRFALIVGMAAAIIVASLGAWNLSLQQQLNQDRQTIQALQVSGGYQKQVTTALAEGAAVMRVGGTSADPSARGAMVQPVQGSAYLVVTGLRPTSPGKVYQLWLVRGTTPLSAGVFHYSGHGTSIVPLPMPASGFAAVAVTVERGPKGSPGPTGPKVLLGSLTA